MRFGTVVRNDLRLQLRHGFYAAYAFVVVVYVALLWQVPATALDRVLPIIVLSETAVIGFFFAGALVMLERGDGVLDALAVTPLRTGEYLAAKVASLTLLTMVAVEAVAVGRMGTRFDALVLAAATAATMPFVVLLGIGMAARFRSLDRFVVWGGLVNAAFGLPVLGYLGILDSIAWYAVPTRGALTLLSAAFDGDASGAAVAGSVVWLAAWTAGMYRFARTGLAARVAGTVRRGHVA